MDSAEMAGEERDEADASQPPVQPQRTERVDENPKPLQVVLALEAPNFRQQRQRRPYRRRQRRQPREPGISQPTGLPHDPQNPQPRPTVTQEHHPRPIFPQIPPPRPTGSQNLPARPAVPQTPRPQPQFAAVPNMLVVNEGENIVEATRRFFDLYKHLVRPNNEMLHVNGIIFCGFGDVSNPQVQVGGVTTFQGRYPIGNLTGRFIIHFDRPVQLDQMVLTFQPGYSSICGFVAGPLIAATSVQVMLGFFPVVG